MNAAFKQVFGEALESLGFAKISVEKHAYLVRVIDHEILHILTYRELRSRKAGYKSFEILGGIVSLYRQAVDFTKSPECWLDNILFYIRDDDLKLDEDIMRNAIQFKCDIWEVPIDREIRIRGSLYKAFTESIVSFMYKSENINGVINALNVTKGVILPVFDRVTDLNSCIDYFYQYEKPMDICCNLEQFNTDPHYYYSEGLLLIKAGYKYDIATYMEKAFEKRVKEEENGTPRLGRAIDINDYKNRFHQKVQQQNIVRDKMLNDSELNAEVRAELERRRACNIQKLESKLCIKNF